ncbi:uncharacterized protein LOC132885838 [Neoarius graeffei]|uniref:uncharacterized protein LOC132885838 n=1 Tax=Neoarius graeffei TaxID=443677 RepID=UPI00298C969B|nr:uncharacterized protein LOC132885838 [Neoarius graeffei]
MEPGTSRTAGRGTDSPGRSGAAEGETVAGHLSRKDVQTLLNLLNVTLPKKVLNDDVINKSRDPMLSSYAENIMKKLKSAGLRIVRKPRLQCWKVVQAFNLKSENKIQDITEMIFFIGRKTHEKTFKEKWEKIPLAARCGFRMKETFAPKETQSAVPEKKASGIKVQSQKNEMNCLRYFIRENRLSDVRYIRERHIEYGFLSGRIDFLIKAKSSEPGPSENIILECKGTRKDLKNLFYVTEGQEVRLKRDNPHYHQTQAYQYILRKTQHHTAPVTAAMVLRKYQKDDQEDQEETDEQEDDHKDNKNEKYRKYKDNKEKLKGEFYCEYVREDMRKFEELNSYCKEKALPLYLAVLNQIFEKIPKKKTVEK